MRASLLLYANKGFQTRSHLNLTACIHFSYFNLPVQNNSTLHLHKNTMKLRTNLQFYCQHCRVMHSPDVLAMNFRLDG